MFRLLSLLLLLVLVTLLAACKPSSSEGRLPATVSAEASLTPTAGPTHLATSPSPSSSPTPYFFEKTVSSGALTLTARLEDDMFAILLTFPGHPSDYNAFQILLDVDRSALTGYHSGILGADLLLENANLFTYTGNGNDWRWLDVTPLELEYQQESNQTRWEIPLSSWLFTCQAVSSKDCHQMLAFAQLADRNWNLVTQMQAMELLFSSP